MSEGRELPSRFSTWQQDENQVHAPPSDHIKRWGLSVSLYNIDFSLLTIVTANHLHPVHTCRGSGVLHVLYNLWWLILVPSFKSSSPCRFSPQLFCFCSARSIIFTGTVQQTAMRRQKKTCALHAHSPFKLRRNTQKCTPLLEEESTQHGQAQFLARLFPGTKYTLSSL